MRISCIHSGSDGNCYTLTDNDGNILLLDCGVPIMDIKRAINFKVSSIIGCIVTHSHL